MTATESFDDGEGLWYTEDFEEACAAKGCVARPLPENLIV